MPGFRVAVLGAGNGGCAAAADLTLRGFEVTLYNRSPERLTPIREQGGIMLTGAAGEGLARVSAVTDRLEEAVRGAEVLLVTVPTSAHTFYAPALARHVSPEQIIMLNPGHMGGSLFFAAELRRHGLPGVPKICETTTLTYACRMQGPAEAKVFSVATNLMFAAFPGRHLDETFATARQLYPQLTKARNVLQTGLQDINAVEHPPQTLCNAGWVEHTKGDFYFYYEGTTPAVARVIEAIDSERMAIARAVGVETKPFVQYFYEAGYTSQRAANLGSAYVALQESEPNRWIKGPRSLDHRYVHEDVGWGLVPWSELGRNLDVPTPVMDAMITTASVMNGIDYRSTGLTLERMGLAGIDWSSLDAFLMEGPAGECEL